MSTAADRLRWRREALLRRADLQRQEFGSQVELITGILGRADRGFAMVRQVATPPVIVATGLAVTLLLGRGRARRALAAGLAVLGLFLRARSMGQLLAGLGRGRPVIP